MFSRLQIIIKCGIRQKALLRQGYGGQAENGKLKMESAELKSALAELRARMEKIREWL